MDKIERMLYMLQMSLSTSKKRHITGGVFLSLSLFFGGLAVTAITLKPDDKENDATTLYKEYEDDEYM